MSILIENHFHKMSEKKYITVNRQIGFAIMGGIAFFIASTLLIPYIYASVLSKSIIGFIGYLIIYLFGGGMFLLFIAMGFIKTTTEIDLATRKVRITKSNIRGASATSEAPLEDLRISAVRMGVSDSAPHGAWIVRAGFMFEGENGEDNSVAIWSKEISGEQNIDERNAIMFELYKFFFPDRPAVNESNIITNGTVVMLLSDTEKEQCTMQEELFEKKPANNNTTDDSKWDRLL